MRARVDHPPTAPGLEGAARQGAGPVLQAHGAPLQAQGSQPQKGVGKHVQGAVAVVV